MAKRLELVHPLDGHTVYVPGENCDSIEQVEGGYALTNGARRRTVPFYRVLVYDEDSRPGLIPEPVTESAEVPDYAVPLESGTGWRCKLCQKKAGTLHGLKTHWGMTHGEL